ncbi:MAG TPA: T9SS type A sorting domain-containing protein [Bacteroidales bacterium]|nr:T9SS type A sorting domain-containing protein [Bacteroidales bacterium]
MKTKTLLTLIAFTVLAIATSAVKAYAQSTPPAGTPVIAMKLTENTDFIWTNFYLEKAGTVWIETAPGVFEEKNFEHDWQSYVVTVKSTSLKIYGNITKFNCARNQENLTGLDVSGNTQLTELQCSENSLTELNVSGNTQLTKLQCSENSLTELNVSGNTQLIELDCRYNKLSKLDLSENTQLTKLQCSENSLTELNVSGNTQLIELDCFSNNLTELNVSSNTQLTELQCGENSLTVLDLSENTQLKELNCRKNSLKNLNIEANTDLRNLDCSYNSFIEGAGLDVSNNTRLVSLLCSNVGLKSLNIVSLIFLKKLDISRNKLDACALDKIYNDLPFIFAGDEALCYNSSNPGTAKSNTSIAIHKNWGGLTKGDGTGCTPTTYPLWVSGIQVNSVNNSKIYGNGISGKVSYNPDTKTLTLNNATITGYYKAEGSGYSIVRNIYSKDDINIELIGNNSLQLDEEEYHDLIFGYGIEAINNYPNYKNIKLFGTGTLNIHTNCISVGGDYYNTGIEGKSIVLDGTITLNIKSSNYGIYSSESNMSVAKEVGLEIATDKTHGHALVCRYEMYPDIENEDQRIIKEGTDADSAKEVPKLTMHDDTNTNSSKPYVSITSIIPLQVAGVKVTSDNASNILDGTVSYEIDTKTLTLTNASNSHRRTSVGIFNEGVKGLKIMLIGDNYVYGESSGLNLKSSTTITGSGTLKTEGYYASISLNNCNLTIDGGCTVTAYSSKGGGILGTYGTEELFINNSTVNATGSMTGSIGNLAELILEDCEIVSPAGAKWDATQKAVVDSEGNVVTEEVVISNTTGIDEVEVARLLNFYPNPAREHITIKIADDLKAETLYIIDISGRIIRTEPISDSIMTLDVSKYAKGIYLIKAGKVNRRLIIK